MRRNLRRASESHREELSLYLHIPFCLSRCRYCDFNTYAGLDSLMPSYAGALDTEAALWSPMATGFEVKTIYFGGGTPSLLGAEHTAAILGSLRSRFKLTGYTEITLEANPATVDGALLARLKALGVTRLSLGIQSFDDARLREIGRRHNAAEAVESFRMARQAGFDNISVDLLYGLPHQDLRRWRATLDRALGLRPEHMSLYALTLEDDTPMAKDVASGELPPQDPDLTADMYESAETALSAAGYEHYEISNWALPGRACRHNLTYWKCGAYLGLGAGAHSCFRGYRFANAALPHDYVKRLEEPCAPLPQGISPGLPGYEMWQELAASGCPVDTAEYIERQTGISDWIVLGLRLMEGISTAEFTARFGERLEDLFGSELAELEEAGLLERHDDRVRLTVRGRFLSNEAFVRFVRPIPPDATLP